MSSNPHQPQHTPWDTPAPSGPGIALPMILGAFIFALGCGGGAADPEFTLSAVLLGLL